MRRRPPLGTAPAANWGRSVAGGGFGLPRGVGRAPAPPGWSGGVGRGGALGAAVGGLSVRVAAFYDKHRTPSARFFLRRPAPTPYRRTNCTKASNFVFFPIELLAHPLPSRLQRRGFFCTHGGTKCRHTIQKNKKSRFSPLGLCLLFA